MLENIVVWVINTIESMGYMGITFLMFIESSFIPFPSEIVIPPAGYLASIGKMNMMMVIVSGTTGSLLGAIFNYWLALKLGRPLIERYGKYFLVSMQSLEKADVFFSKHGHISTFTGRLLPVIRQYISLPAGLTRMSIGIFCLFTTLGSGIWVVILALVGYWIGDNAELVKSSVHEISIFLIIFCVLLVSTYIYWVRKDRIKKLEAGENGAGD